MVPHTPAPLSIRTFRNVILAGLFVTLWGCQTSPEVIQEGEIAVIERSVNENTPLPEPATGQQSQSPELLPPDTELFHDVITAFIAAQRSQPETALEHISRAALQSGNRRLLRESIRMAVNNQEFGQAIDLARLLEPFEPDDYLTAILVARAHFRLGETGPGLDLLADLIEKCGRDHGYIFQTIAESLAATKNPDLSVPLREALESRPDNAALQLTAALVAARLNQPKRYVEQLDRVLALEPDWEFPATLLLVQLRYSNSDHSVGEDQNGTGRSVSQFAMERLEAWPEHLRFRLQFARHLIENGDIEPALGQLNTALDMNPDTLEALFAIGAIYFEQGDLIQSRDYFVRYLRLDPDNDQARIYLSDIEYRQGDYAAASNYLYGVVSSQYYLDAQIRLANILAKRYEVDTGIRHLRQIDAASDEGQIRLILQQDLLFREYDRYAEAKQVLDEGLEQFPDQPDLLYNRGLVTAKMNRLDLHERDMRKLIEIEPDNAHAYNAFGYVLADKTDRLEEAMALIKKANALLPDNPFILDSMGWVHFRLGNTSKAIEYLMLALDARQDAEIAAHLGEVLWVTGSREEARKIWEKGIEWDPGNGILRQTIERLSQ